MGLGIPPLKMKILLESNPLKSRTSVRRFGHASEAAGCVRMFETFSHEQDGFNHHPPKGDTRVRDPSKMSSGARVAHT